MRTRRETPVKCVGRKGDVTWKARYTNKVGRRVSAGTYALKGPCRNPRFPAADCCAQHAIDAAYDKDEQIERRRNMQTLGEFASTWTDRFPRAESTNAANQSRLAAVLDVKIEGRKLRHWPYRDLRRRHARDLAEHLLTRQKRAAEGARGILRTLSAMTQDALDEEICELNAFMSIKIRNDDRRIVKPARKPNIYTLAQMHAFAAGVPAHEAMIRVLSDCGLRLGELIGLSRADFTGDEIRVRGSAQANGKFVEGDTPTKHHVRNVPIDACTAALIVPRIDTQVLFATPTGKTWLQSNFYKCVWKPAREATPSMAAARPHDFRHSWVSIMRAKGIDQADLAQIAGHSVDTATGIYTHALNSNRSADAVRAAIAEG